MNTAKGNIFSLSKSKPFFSDSPNTPFGVMASGFAVLLK